jgi:hypothetical protein
LLLITVVKDPVKAAVVAEVMEAVQETQLL